MTDNGRKVDSRNRGRMGGANDAMLSLADSIDDLQSILDTLDSLGIKDRDELIDYIEALEDELAQLESLDDE